MNQIPLALEIIRAEHKALILDALQGHRGAANGISVKELALRTLRTSHAFFRQLRQLAAARGCGSAEALAQLRREAP